MRVLIPATLLLAACASAPSARKPSGMTASFRCTGDGDTAPRTTELLVIHDGSRLKLAVKYHYLPKKGVPNDPYFNEFSYTADWVRPPLGSDPKLVNFVYSPGDYGGTYEKVVIPADELNSGKLEHIQIFESSNPVKGQGGEGSLDCKPIDID